MLNNIPKPVLLGGIVVIVLLALVIVFKSAKSAGGSGDYDANEIRRLAQERESKPNSGRNMPASTQRRGSPDRNSPNMGSPTSGGR